MSPGWIAVGVIVFVGVIEAWFIGRDRFARYEVAVRGNSSTNREIEPSVTDHAYTRRGARRIAGRLNSGPTGTGILKAEVRRRAR